MKNLKGSLILLFAAVIWGTAFVAQTSGADSVGTFTFNMSRCFIAGIFLGVVILIREWGARKRIFAVRPPDARVPARRLLRGGVCCGVALFLAMSCQQAGIGMYPDHVAASGRAGFLTAIYVVLVAIIAQLKERRIQPSVMFSVAGIMCGMYFLCLYGGFTSFYMGDLFELLCAVFFSVQIMLVDHFSDMDSVKLSCLEFLTCGALSLAFCLVFETVDGSELIAAALPILYAGIMSSGIAYTLQIVGQKYAQPAVASIVMSLESAFAAVSGCLILGESLSIHEAAGCALIFASVILAQVPQLGSGRRHDGAESG